LSQPSIDASGKQINSAPFDLASAMAFSIRTKLPRLSPSRMNIWHKAMPGPLRLDAIWMIAPMTTIARKRIPHTDAPSLMPVMLSILPWFSKIFSMIISQADK
jgi:hypothetical protein